MCVCVCGVCVVCVVCVWCVCVVCMCVCLIAQLCLTVTLWTVARQAPLSIGFSRQKYWSELPFPSPEHFLELFEVSSNSPWLIFQCFCEGRDVGSLRLCHVAYVTYHFLFFKD